ncbi:tRNA glutamyl-Q(34) synthetase GluQRS [Ferrimonas senticii]|uniref:tRNA glutamyl-Q(34) synthetase GluQRS n=1 Tax=Ferrimonas senticii TaxID=394566 RepID=UPI00041A1998|nr:tRNA glutamyl-Q(34) synthetase GluQRS [Ferrimonas senticii]
MNTYVGRFAPSPSGPLHFGSLIAALGSYLRARSLQGQWLVRIEDVDPPREMAGAADIILRQLERYGLEWDGSVRYQSQQSERYEQLLAQLLASGRGYYCDCTRKRISAIGGIYDGHCHNLGLTQGAIRLRNQAQISHFNDGLLGHIDTEYSFAAEDFILKRRDGLYAYQLAVVADDHDQGITEVVRGNDLLEPTVRQCSLYQTLSWQAPQWLHLPLAINPDGNKLSKQNHAPALSESELSHTMASALAFLGQALPTELASAPVAEQLRYAVTHFQLARLPQQRQRPVPTLA